MSAALAIEGLIWLAVAVLFAGIVRGFTGFGSALVYLPVAGMYLPPATVIATMIAFSMIGPLPLLPRGWRECNKGEVLRLGAAAVIGVPLGVYLLTKLDGDSFRWLVSGLAMVTLAVLASGWRYSRPLSSVLTAGTGFLSGLLGGFIGLAGPPVILLYLGGRKAVIEIRAVILVFLFSVDFSVMLTFIMRDLITVQALLIGLMLVPSYMIGGLIGARLFDPMREGLFRAIAYVIILIAALTGLPLFD